MRSNSNPNNQLFMFIIYFINNYRSICTLGNKDFLLLLGSGTSFVYLVCIFTQLKENIWYNLNFNW